jgi:hypothetical protein
MAFELAIQLSSKGYRSLKKKDVSITKALEGADKAYFVDDASTNVDDVRYLWYWKDVSSEIHNFLLSGLLAVPSLGFWSFDLTKKCVHVEREDFQHNTFDVFACSEGLHIDPGYSGHDPMFDEVKPSEGRTYRRGSFTPKEGVGSWL